MKRLLLCAGLLFPLASEAITLEEALASAISSDPTLMGRYARFNALLEERGVVTSEYWPQLSLSAGIGPEETKYSSGQLIDEELTRDEASLRIGWLLFNGFETQANSKRLSHEAEAERLQLIADAENLALDVCNIYLQAREAEMLVTLSKHHVEDHEQIMNDVKRLVSSGFANDGDVAQVSARLANARSSLVSAQNNYRDVSAQFLRLVNQMPSNLTDPVADSVLLPKTLEEAVEWAKASHPQLQSAMSDIQAAKQEVRASKSGYYPKISIEGYANKGHDQGGFEGPDEDYRVMLTMRYDLFNGGRDRSRARASNWRYNEALAIRTTAERDLMEGTALSWNALQSLTEQELLIRQSVDASSLAETTYMEQYKLGKRTLLDLLNAKVEVFSARRNYLATKYNQLQSNYRLLNATGRLGYALRIAYPQEWAGKESEQ
ncbi:TolC family outer membrane protein [Cellvibrio sp. NN19]|uniref:TolC family outer membrane protein n=1 Tax=Cellvibrio chitinivorans TaxID=3102792 RepID=UPI002B40E21C|nr:TolC family outer membrane protein [Cellvibrio sp. NN19]